MPQVLSAPMRNTHEDAKERQAIHNIDAFVVFERFGLEHRWGIECVYCNTLVHRLMNSFRPACSYVGRKSRRAVSALAYSARLLRWCYCARLGTVRIGGCLPWVNLHVPGLEVLVSHANIPHQPHGEYTQERSRARSP